MTSDSAAPGAGGPAVARRRLAAGLRQHREAAGLTMEQAAALLEWSSAKISRIENAQVSVLPRDARLLAGIYRVDGDGQDRLTGLARQTRQKAWWHDYGLTLPAGLQAYTALEAEAEVLRSYHPELVPPLLQTPAYQHATTPPLPGGDAGQATALLTARQHRHATAGSPLLHVIPSEAVLRRPAGGPAVMADQLSRLAEQAAQPHITVQVLPFTAGAHPAMDTPFTLFTFPADPDIAWPGPQAITCLDSPADVQHYQHLFTRLHDLALTPDESAT